jgi:hypothetical protein
MTEGCEAEAAARELIEHWGAKDTDRVARLLHPNALLTGPLVPGGRAVGSRAIRAFLDAENADPSILPAADRDSYEFMARARARVANVVACDTRAALECEVAAGAGRSLTAALFVDLHAATGSIERLALYLDPRQGV